MCALFTSMSMVIEESTNFPQIVLDGVSETGNIEFSSSIDMTWPNFHNGAAYGFKFCKGLNMQYSL